VEAAWLAGERAQSATVRTYAAMQLEQRMAALAPEVFDRRLADQEAELFRVEAASCR